MACRIERVGTIEFSHNAFVGYNQIGMILIGPSISLNASL